MRPLKTWPTVWLDLLGTSSVTAHYCSFSASPDWCLCSISQRPSHIY